MAGTPRALEIEGIPFRVAGDTDIAETPTKWEVTVIATSGDGEKVMKKRIESREGIVLITKAAELIQLKALAERVEDLKCSYTDADGTVWQCEGGVNVEPRQSAENRTTIQIHPTKNDGEWIPIG